MECCAGFLLDYCSRSIIQWKCKAMQMLYVLQTVKEYGLPLVIETDEKLKCDKYCHLGVKLVKKREFGDSRYGYGMIYED